MKNNARFGHHSTLLSILMVAPMLLASCAELVPIIQGLDKDSPKTAASAKPKPTSASVSASGGGAVDGASDSFDSALQIVELPGFVKPESALAAKDPASQSAQYQLSMNNHRASVKALIDKSQQSKDIIRLGCLNGKLDQIDVKISASNKRAEALAQFLADKDEASAKTELAKIADNSSAVRSLKVEADNCQGEDIQGVAGNPAATPVKPALLPEFGF